MSGSPRALVIGGSVAGLLCGLLLRKAGWRVSVFERAVGDLAGRGAGLGVSRELLDIMARAGARFDASAGVPQDEHVWMQRDGSIAFSHKRNLMASAWARVYQPLRAAFGDADYHAGTTLQHVEQAGDKVIARFANDASEEGDLLIGADGVYSTVRKQFLPDVQPVFANYVAWRGLVEERDMPRETLDAVAKRIVFCFPPGELLLSMVAPGTGEDTRPGHRRMYFIWYRGVTREALADLFTDAKGTNHGISIPPPLIRPEHIRKMKADARDVLPGPIASMVEGAAQPLLQAIGDMESPRMRFGRVILAGDAAFVVRPHVAAGAGKAAMDAVCLADSLASSPSIDDALDRYERSQMDFGSRIVRHSRHLGADLEARRPVQNPPQVIVEYGAPMLLHDA